MKTQLRPRSERHRLSPGRCDNAWGDAAAGGHGLRWRGQGYSLRFGDISLELCDGPQVWRWPAETLSKFILIPYHSLLVSGRLYKRGLQLLRMVRAEPECGRENKRFLAELKARRQVGRGRRGGGRRRRRPSRDYRTCRPTAGDSPPARSAQDPLSLERIAPADGGDTTLPMQVWSGKTNLLMT